MSGLSIYRFCSIPKPVHRGAARGYALGALLASVALAANGPAANAAASNLIKSFMFFGTSTIQTVAVDESFIYLASGFANDSVWRASLDGGQVDPEFIYDAEGSSLAIDQDFVYFNTLNDRIAHNIKSGTPKNLIEKSKNAPPGTFFSVAFNDPGRKESFIIPDPDCRCVSAFAVDPSPPALARGRFVYWSSPDLMAIGRAKIDGTDVQISFISNITSSPRGMAVDANYLYWTKTDGRSIGRAKVDGSEVNEDFIADAGSHPWGIAVNATHIYWSTHSGGSVGQANLDGSNVDSRYISLGTVPYGIALGIGANANHIYVATDSNLVRADIPTSSGPTSANFTAALQSPNANQMLVLAWSTNAIGFTLQSTVSLVPPVIWTPAATPPVTIGENFVVTNSPSGILRYYRLRMPN